SRKAASDTTRNALAGAFGIGLGILFWAFLAIFGLASLSRADGLIQYVIMCLGGSYLAYSGIKMLNVTKSVKLQAEKDKAKNETSLLQEIGKGLMINLSNAKVIVFFSSVLSGYMAKISGYPAMFTIIFLLALETFFYFSIISFFFSRKVVRNFYNKYNRYIDNFAGIVFVMFGADLIYQGLINLNIGA
ncbi:MAG TPA: hypothetical protein DD638_05730, partial [Pasteurellaceae bacterium]|nr:hypothetical protein [Pasteurellaceae bacterium]